MDTPQLVSGVMLSISRSTADCIVQCFKHKGLCTGMGFVSHEDLHGRSTIQSTVICEMLHITADI